MVASQADAHAAADPLVEAYAAAWQRVVDLQQSLADDPALARQKERLDRTRRGIERDLRSLSDRTDEWTKRQLPGVYQAGGEHGSEDFSWSQSHRDAAETLSRGLRRDLLAANTRTAQTTRELIRRVGRDRALASAIEGRTAVQAGREMTRLLEAHGIHSVVYSNGAKVGLGPYSQMAIRTATATAYNEGTLNAADADGVLHFEVFDGSQCGWARHDDTVKANGRVVTRADAEEHPISHPQCRRAFEARPDLGRVAKPKAVPAEPPPGLQEVEASSFDPKHLGTPDKAQQWLINTHGTKGLTKDERLALRMWQQGQFQNVSKFLREGQLDVIVTGGGGRRVTVHSVEEWRRGVELPKGHPDRLSGQSELTVLENLPSVFAKHQLPDDVTLWRGANIQSLRDADPASLIGTTVEDKSFMATSASSDGVDALAPRLGFESDQGVIFEIRARKGQNYTTPEIIGKTGYSEVLLPAGTRVRVIEVVDEDHEVRYEFTKMGKAPREAQPRTVKRRRIVVEIVNG